MISTGFCKAYIDIDGVLLTKQMTVPEYAEPFIDFLLQNFNCHWLTTHCRGGENKAIPYLQQFYGPSTMAKFKQIRPTDWSTLKTEGIDLESDFIWLEDYPFEAEKKVLSLAGKRESLILVDLSRPHELDRLFKVLTG